MNKFGLVMSMLLSFLGILLLSVGLLVQALLPKIGRMAFMIGGGSYNPNEFELGVWFYLYLAVAVLCIARGIGLSRSFYAADSGR